VGQFTAEAVGLREIRVTAAKREEAISRVQERLRNRFAVGQLVSINVSTASPLPTWAGNDPNDAEEKAFLAELARAKQEDLVNTLRELEQECSNTTSTPTT
jgi:hypothetical protein